MSGITNGWLERIYEDDDLLILNKKEGMHCLPRTEAEQGTAVDSAVYYCGDLPKRFPDSIERGLLNRLDLETSGALAFAKHAESYQFYRGCWTRREGSDGVGKFYHAWVCSGATARDQEQMRPSAPRAGVLRHWIGHSKKSSKRMLTAHYSEVEDPPSLFRRQLKGDPKVAVLEVLSVDRMVEGAVAVWDLELRLKTGWMHQIRVQLKEWGFPIVGDLTYGYRGGSRLWLHASQLSLPRREGGSLIVASAPLPNWSEVQQDLEILLRQG